MEENPQKKNLKDIKIENEIKYNLIFLQNSEKEIKEPVTKLDSAKLLNKIPDFSPEKEINVNSNSTRNYKNNLTQNLSNKNIKDKSFNKDHPEISTNSLMKSINSKSNLNCLKKDSNEIKNIPLSKSQTQINDFHRRPSNLDKNKNISEDITSQSSQNISNYTKDLKISENKISIPLLNNISTNKSNKI